MVAGIRIKDADKWSLVPVVFFQSGGYPVRLVRQGRYLHHWLIVNASCSLVLILTADSLPVHDPLCIFGS